MNRPRSPRRDYGHSTAFVDRIQKALECSTAHVTKHDAELLDQHSAKVGDDRDEPIRFFRTIDHGYGWIILIGHREPSDFESRIQEGRTMGFSHDFLTLIRHANALGCYYIDLDRDADTIDGLPIFDW